MVLMAMGLEQEDESGQASSVSAAFYISHFIYYLISVIVSDSAYLIVLLHETPLIGPQGFAFYS